MGASAYVSINNFKSLTVEELEDIKSGIESRIKELDEQNAEQYEIDRMNCYTSLLSLIKSLVKNEIKPHIPEQYKKIISYKVLERFCENKPYMITIVLAIKGISCPFSLISDDSVLKISCYPNGRNEYTFDYSVNKDICVQLNNGGLKWSNDSIKDYDNDLRVSDFNEKCLLKLSKCINGITDNIVELFERMQKIAPN